MQRMNVLLRMVLVMLLALKPRSSSLKVSVYIFYVGNCRVIYIVFNFKFNQAMLFLPMK